MQFRCFTEPVTVSGGEGGHQERHSEGVRDSRQRDQDPSRVDRPAPHECGGHARLHGQPGARLRSHGSK